MEIVKTAAARLEPTTHPNKQRGRRPGWVAPLVLKVLETAGEPMTAEAIRQTIVRRFGEQPAYESVWHVLRHGKEARQGLIEPAGGGHYAAAGT